MEVKDTDFVRGDALLAKLGDHPVTKRERELIARYTAIRPVTVKGEPDAHTAWLVVDHQRFCLTPVYMDTAEEAALICWKLATALWRLIDQQAARTVGEEFPRFADGVIAHPGDVGWFPGEKQAGKVNDTGRLCGNNDWGAETKECYSTFEAAEAAGGF